MSAEWQAVDTLLRELGAVRAAASGLRASDFVHDVVETAIAEAATAIADILDSPASPQRLARAHDAIEVAAEVIALIDAQLARSVSIRTRGAEVRARARELIAQARPTQDQLGRGREKGRP